MEPRWDAVIVGAGVAGASLAALLARSGRRVALVDAASFPRQKVCGEHLDGRAQRLLGGWGFELPPAESAARVNRVSLVLPGDRRYTAPVSTRSGQAIAVSRSVLDLHLVNTAVHCGAEFFPSSRVRHVLIERNRVAGVCAGAIELRAQATIAADGRDSFIVKKTGRIRRRGPPRVGFKQHVPLSDSHRLTAANELAMFSLPGGYLGAVPIGLGQWNICGVISRSTIKSAGGLKPALLAATRGHRRLHELLAAEANGWHTVPRVQTQTATASYPGVLYIGDARGAIEPLAGQGMLMGVVSAELAYRTLDQARGEPLTADAQRAYDRAWDAAFVASLGTAHWLAKLVCRPRLLEAMAMVDHLRRGLAEQVFCRCYELSAGAMPCLHPVENAAADAFLPAKTHSLWHG